MEYMGGRNFFTSIFGVAGIVLLGGPDCPIGVGVTVWDEESVFDGEMRSGSSNFMVDGSGAITRAASPKDARFRLIEEAEDRCVTWDWTDRKDGLELPEDLTSCDSLDPVVRGLHDVLANVPKAISGRGVGSARNLRIYWRGVYWRGRTE